MLFDNVPLVNLWQAQDMLYSAWEKVVDRYKHALEAFPELMSPIPFPLKEKNDLVYCKGLL